MVYRCIVPGCSNNSENKELSFHAPPKDAAIFRKWVEAIPNIKPRDPESFCRVVAGLLLLLLVFPGPFAIHARSILSFGA